MVSRIVVLLLDNSCVPDCFYTFLLKVQYDKDIIYFTDCCACSFQTQQLVDSRYSGDNDKMVLCYNADGTLDFNTKDWFLPYKPDSFL